MEVFGLVCMFGITAFDDIRTKQVRLIEIVIFGILGVAYNLIFKPYPISSVVGGVAVGAAVLIFSIASKEKIGKGDAYIIMVAGLFLGFMNTMLLLWLSSIYAAIIGLLLMQKYKGVLEKELPFIPFLLLGYLTLYANQTIRGVIL